MFRYILQRVQPIYYKWIKWYYRIPRDIVKRGLRIKLYPSVFHPTHYLSTDIFLDFLMSQDVKDKRVLELGAGNGFISLYLAKHYNCLSFASDINPSAIKGLQENANFNQVKLTTFLSDLFDDIPTLTLDYILVNPPYYPGVPQSVDEYAFYAGNDYEYFIRFFDQISSYLLDGTIVYMILSDNQYVQPVIELAQNVNITFTICHEQVKKNENFIVYQLMLS